MAAATPLIETNVRSGAQWLIQALEAEGVDVIFGYPGGAIMPVYDALLGSRLRHILVRHEQGAALAADGYARACGKVGVCLATSGPGATNLITGIANAFMDSVPIVAITGQVSTRLMGTDAFQEVDVFGLTLPIVKHSFIVRKVEDVASVIHQAFAIAREGRPGPVLIDFPKDVAIAMGVCHIGAIPRRALGVPSGKDIERARALLAAARKPVLYVGGGVNLADAEEQLRAFAAACELPTVCTLKGLGAADPDAELYLGMLGMHGTQAANLAVHDCDLLICAGARFDDRATGKLDEFAARAAVIHLDADPAEIGKLRNADVALCGNLRSILPQLAQTIEISDWRIHCLALKTRHAWRYDAPGEGIYAPELLRKLSLIAGDKAIVACDVGQHQMWVAQHWRIPRTAAHLTSGGLGTMGFGVPAAMGAKLGCPNATVICVSGDGSIMMNIQELATLRRYGIDIKIVLLDNASLGMVRQWQELFFAQRYSEVDLSDNPDFTVLAHAFGIDAFAIERRDQVDAAITRLLDSKGPTLCHVKIDARANVWPLVPPGKSNANMIEGAQL